MPTNDFLPFAAAGGAGVLTQAEYAALAGRLTGFVDGIAEPAEVNKVWRQASVMAAMLGQFIGDYGALDALDDGDVADLVRDFARSIQRGTFAYVVATGTANAWTVAPTPTVAAYAAGRVLWIKAPATNTATTVTANISGLGTRPVKKSDAADPQIGDLVSGRLYPTIDDGTNICVVTPLPSDIPNFLSAFRVTGGRQVVFGPGSGTWTVPAGVTSIFVKMNGGGAGGGGAYTGGSYAAAGVGGGGGEYAEGAFSVTPGDVLSYSVPNASAGGAGSASPTAGANGGTTTFGGLISAAGGVGGAAGLNGVASGGGTGGTGGSGGGRRLPGGGGGFGVVPSSANAQGGQGGHSPFGGPGTSPNINAAGTVGNGPGGGGAGGGAVSGGANGGNGAAGTLVIQY